MPSPIHPSTTLIGSQFNCLKVNYFDNGTKNQTVNESPQGPQGKSSNGQDDEDEDEGRPKKKESKQMTRQSGSPTYTDRGELVIPDDMFSARDCSMARADLFFDDYYSLMDPKQFGRSGAVPKTDENIDIFRNICQRIRSQIKEKGSQLFKVTVVNEINKYIAETLGPDAPKIRGFDHMQGFIRDLHAHAKKAVPSDPLFVQRVLHKCVYTLNSKGSSYSNKTLRQHLNEMGSKAFPRYNIDADLGTNQKKLEVLKIAVSDYKNLKRCLNIWEEEACNLSVRCNYNNSWITSGYHVITFDSVSLNNTKAYILMKVAHAHHLGNPKTESELIHRLLIADRVAPALPDMDCSPTTNIRNQFNDLIREMEAQGINVQNFMAQNMKPLLGAGNQLNHISTFGIGSDLECDSHFDRNSLTSPHSLLSGATSDQGKSDQGKSSEGASSPVPRQVAFDSHEGESSLVPEKSAFDEAYGTHVDNLMKEKAKKVSLSPEQTRLFDRNVGTKSVGLPGANEKAYQFVGIHAFDDGLGWYYDMKEPNKLVKMRDHQQSKSDPIALVEWQESTPGEYELERYTWVNFKRDVPFGMGTAPRYFDLQEGVR